MSVILLPASRLCCRIRSLAVITTRIRGGISTRFLRVALVSVAIFGFILAVFQRFQRILDFLTGTETDAGAFNQSFFHVFRDECARTAQRDIERTEAAQTDDFRFF